MKRSGTVSRRQLMTSLGLLSLSAVGTGCWGTFALTGKVHDWNGSFGSKWVSWIVFVAFVIIPVYGTLLFLDAIIFNTIEFFSGKNVIQRSADLGNGERMVFRPVEGDKDTMEIEHTRGSEVVRTFRIQKTSDGLRLHDAQGERLHALEDADGAARLRQADGTELANLSSNALDAVEGDLRDGATPSDAIVSRMDGTTVQSLLAMADSLSVGVRV